MLWRSAPGFLFGSTRSQVRILSPRLTSQGLAKGHVSKRVSKSSVCSLAQPSAFPPRRQGHTCGGLLKMSDLVAPHRAARTAGPRACFHRWASGPWPGACWLGSWPSAAGPIHGESAGAAAGGSGQPSSRTWRRWSRQQPTRLVGDCPRPVDLPMGRPRCCVSPGSSAEQLDEPLLR
jgi:hypothetical protein